MQNRIPHKALIAHEFAAAMAPTYLADHFPSSDVQRREQGGRAVTHVIVGELLSDAGCQRQLHLSQIYIGLRHLRLCKTNNDSPLRPNRVPCSALSNAVAGLQRRG